MLPESIQNTAEIFIGALLILIWLYVAARLMVWGGARSWFSALHKWKNDKQSKGED